MQGFVRSPETRWNRFPSFCSAYVGSRKITVSSRTFSFPKRRGNHIFLRGQHLVVYIGRCIGPNLERDPCLREAAPAVRDPLAEAVEAHPVVCRRWVVDPAQTVHRHAAMLCRPRVRKTRRIFVRIPHKTAQGLCIKDSASKATGTVPLFISSAPGYSWPAGCPASSRMF